MYGEFDASESESIRGKFHWAIRFWILFSLVNSVFSIYWDLFMDWELFAGKRGHLRISTLSSFFQLRSVLVFKYPLLYYGAATLNVYVFSIAYTKKTDATCMVGEGWHVL